MIGGAAGSVLVYLQVTSTGRPARLRVLRGIGGGMDEAALDAVSHYRLKPAMRGSRPVSIEMNVDVNFASR